MSYRKTTGSYKSSDGVTDIAYAVFTPVIPAVAVLQIVHGMCEYFARYEEFAAYLADNGVVVCGEDHLGHGDTAKSPEDYGFFGSKDGDRHLVDDVEGLRALIRKRYRALPYFMLGHSMGSFIARSYITRYGSNIDGVIISGTSGGDQPLKFGKFLARVICALRGERYRSRLLRNISMGSYNKRFASENDITSWLSRNLENRRQYAADPRCTFIFTARGYYDLFSLLQSVSGEDWAPSVPRGLPIFIISGGEDPVGDYGKGPQLVADRLQDCEVYDISFRIYPDMRHEILNEVGREQVYSDVLEWIMRVREGVIEDRMGLPSYFSPEDR